MEKLANLQPNEVFKYFEDICSIPHGSYNMDKISKYCVDFANSIGLKVIRDEANNVVIYKDGTKGNENKLPVILQGHIDMVCQKTVERKIDFENDGLDIYVDGDFVKANGTTLGADNGIAVAMIMAILASKDLQHPPIEAVFTTDEEVGMIGASKLDVSVLNGKQMINIDSEEQDVLTVSCAGGSDVKITLPKQTKTVNGTKVTIEINGLKGGHSGVEIDKNRVNANILAGRILNHISDFDLIKIDGGNKGNAIPLHCETEVCVKDAESFVNALKDYEKIIAAEIKDREENFSLNIMVGEEGSFKAMDPVTRDKLVYMLLTTPNGIIDMSAVISGLVETSLNLGILQTQQDSIFMQYALRSNKSTALDFLEEKMVSFAKFNGCIAEKGGRYQPWEYKEKSYLRELYIETYKEMFGVAPKVEAIHAGLECAVFSSTIKDLDCIAIGPSMFGVHTVEERLSISSTNAIFQLLSRTLEKLC